jgi:hypothetical protein
MAGSGLPCTVVICCSLPAGMGSDEVASRLEAGRRAELPITWLAAPEWLNVVVEACGGAGLTGGVALEIPAGCPRSAARDLLAHARRAVPALDAAVIHGPLDAASRQDLAGSGIRVVCRDGFEPPARGSRRPAPKGWRCHSPVWGLWEVARAAEPVPPTGLGRLLGIGAATTLGSGGLAVVDVAEGVPASGATATIRGRLGRWKAWAASRHSSSPTTFTPLSRLPDLIAGAGQVPVGGSILRAA